jgi:hypothetical protein
MSEDYEKTFYSVGKKELSIQIATSKVNIIQIHRQK